VSWRRAGSGGGSSGAIWSRLAQRAPRPLGLLGSPARRWTMASVCLLDTRAEGLSVCGQGHALVRGRPLVVESPGHRRQGDASGRPWTPDVLNRRRSRSAWSTPWRRCCGRATARRDQANEDRRHRGGCPPPTARPQATACWRLSRWLRAAAKASSTGWSPRCAPAGQGSRIRAPGAVPGLEERCTRVGTWGERLPCARMPSKRRREGAPRWERAPRDETARVGQRCSAPCCTTGGARARAGGLYGGPVPDVGAQAAPSGARPARREAGTAAPRLRRAPAGASAAAPPGVPSCAGGPLRRAWSAP